MNFILYAISFLSVAGILAYIDFVYFVPEITAKGFNAYSFHGMTVVATCLILALLLIPAMNILGDFFFGKQKPSNKSSRA